MGNKYEKMINLISNILGNKTARYHCFSKGILKLRGNESLDKVREADKIINFTSLEGYLRRKNCL